MTSVLKEFKQFILRGNLVDLAVAVVIGTAFGAVITALVADVITPLIAAVGGKADFSKLAFRVNGSTFHYGHFLNALLTFLLVSAVIFFLVLKPVNLLMARHKVDTPVEARTRACPECRSDIPVEATRCAFCTTRVPPAPASSDVREPAT